MDLGARRAWMQSAGSSIDHGSPVEESVTSETVIVYEAPDHEVTYLESSGCGGSCGCGCGSYEAEASNEGSGCGGGTSESESGSSGCEGDDSESSSAASCESDDASRDDGAGCDSSDDDDVSESSNGCDEDATASASRPANLCASVAPTCHRAGRRHVLSGPLQNYLWIGLALLFPGWRARGRRA